MFCIVVALGSHGHDTVQQRRDPHGANHREARCQHQHAHVDADAQSYCWLFVILYGQISTIRFGVNSAW